MQNWMQVVNIAYQLPTRKWENNIASPEIVRFLKQTNKKHTHTKKPTTHLSCLHSWFSRWCSLLFVFISKSLKSSLQCKEGQWGSYEARAGTKKEILLYLGVQQEPNDSVSLIILKIYHEKAEEAARINIKVSLAFWLLGVKESKKYL